MSFDYNRRRIEIENSLDNNIENCLSILKSDIMEFDDKTKLYRIVELREVTYNNLIKLLAKTGVKKTDDKYKLQILKGLEKTYEEFLKISNRKIDEESEESEINLLKAQEKVSELLPIILDRIVEITDKELADKSKIEKFEIPSIIERYAV